MPPRTSRRSDADPLATGQAIFEKMRGALLDAAAASVAFCDDKKAMRRLGVAMGRNPRHFLTAINRFPEQWNGESTADIWELLATLALHKVESDNDAARLYYTWQQDKSRGYAGLLTDIKEYAAARAPKAKRATLAERIIAIIDENQAPGTWINDKVPNGVLDVLAQLANLPEVAAVLARRAKAEAER